MLLFLFCRLNGGEQHPNGNEQRGTTHFSTSVEAAKGRTAHNNIWNEKMEWHQTHGNYVFDVFDTIPLIPLQPLPRAHPPQRRFCSYVVVANVLQAQS